ncbi:hypothetical protein RN001_005116 [Aquatica leii]|uniref:Electron transfer flavoprotein subunit alpha n=1 Tax=Aquatica leii TaxID=1421715 RepID=A0AAN7Q0S0_9COLE|nr:hypothetical protein RN001_005116 [Aquatica leii]
MMMVPTLSSFFLDTSEYRPSNNLLDYKKNSSTALDSKRLGAGKELSVIAEHNIKHITPTTQVILAAARKISDNIIVLIPGTTNSTVAKYLSTRKGVSKVLTAENVDNDGFPEENFTSTILATHKIHNFSHIIGVSSQLGKSVLPRVAAKLDVPAVTNIVNVKTPDTFVRSIYAGKAFMTIKVMDPVKVIIVKEGCCSSNCRGNQAPIESAPIEEGLYSVKSQKMRLNKSKLPLLVDAKTVICGGGGLQSSENFLKLYEVANALDAAVGATKSAVDRGFAPKSLQVGQIGTTIAPDLYIGIGVSGNLEHITGIKDSRVIVAINKDCNAPLFKVADFGVVMDLFDALPTLKYLLRHF